MFFLTYRHDWAQIWVISARNHDVVVYTYSV